VTSEEARPVAGPPRQVRVAGWSVGLQGLVGVVFAVVLAVQALRAGEGPGSAFGAAGYFLIVGAALVGVGIGLVAGKRGARTPAIVAELLLLPVVYSLLGPSKQLVWGIVTGALVIATFLLLISDAARGWSMGLPDRDRPGPDAPGH
jgi:hypothetical protein